MNIKLSFILPIALFLLVIISRPFAAVDTLTADTLSKWITDGTSFDFILIDVRDTSELTQIIASSDCKPYHFSLNQNVFDAMVPKLPKTMPTICYCRSGVRSGTAAQKLNAAGFASVYTLQGGFSNYALIVSRPTGVYADVKPTSSLPSPSMLKTSIKMFSTNKPYPLKPVLHIHNNTVYSTSFLFLPHALSITDISGKQIACIDNPFLLSRTFALPHQIASGTYVISLQETACSVFSCKTSITK